MSDDSRTDDFGTDDLGTDDLGTDEPRTTDSLTEETGDDSWREEGVIGLLLVAGIVLFVVPEPATTMLGTLLIVAGVVGWVVNRFR